MTRYALYQTSDGALVRHEESDTAKPSLASAKGLIWTADPAPTLTAYQDEIWNTGTHQSEAVLKSLADQKAIKKQLIKAKASEIIEDGFIYEIPASGDPHTYQIDDKAQNNMTSVGAKFGIGDTNAHNGFWRDADDEMVTMDDDEVKGLLLAAGDYKQAIISNMWALCASVDAAEDQTGFNAVDIESGWPANGS